MSWSDFGTFILFADSIIAGLFIIGFVGTEILGVGDREKEFVENLNDDELKKYYKKYIIKNKSHNEILSLYLRQEYNKRFR